MWNHHSREFAKCNTRPADGMRSVSERSRIIGSGNVQSVVKGAPPPRGDAPSIFRHHPCLARYSARSHLTLSSCPHLVRQCLYASLLGHPTESTFLRKNTLSQHFVLVIRVQLSCSLRVRISQGRLSLNQTLSSVLRPDSQVGPPLSLFRSCAVPNHWSKTRLMGLSVLRVDVQIHLRTIQTMFRHQRTARCRTCQTRFSACALICKVIHRIDRVGDEL